MILWGAVVLVFSLAVCVMLNLTGNSKWNFLWFGIVAVGWPLSAICLRGKSKQGGKSFISRSIGQIWISYGIFATVLSSVFAFVAPQFTGYITAVLLGFAAVMTGFILKNNYITAGGFITGIGCTVALFFTPVEFTPVFFTIASILNLIVPGIMMNKKVKELGLKNTFFKNCTGLDEEGHYSSAYDMAVIARELLKHEKILEFSSVYEDYLREDTDNKFWLVNTNKLVRFYEGADGLKTGHTDAAKYCLAATAKRDDLRLIAIVLGEDDSQTRNSETMNLLDYGFNNYKIKILKTTDDIVKEISLDKATSPKISLVPMNDIAILSKKSADNKKYTYDIKITNNNLPLKKGDEVGKIIVKDSDSNKIKEEGLTVTENVDKLNFLELLGKTLTDMMVGNMNFV